MISMELTGRPVDAGDDRDRMGLVADELYHLALQPTNVMAEDGNYVVLRAMADRIPAALHEIGRLREITGRETGPGSGRDVDLDHFDLYYLHMVIWDKSEREIVGACRIGQMDLILKRYGHRGLYTGTLFRYSPLFMQRTGPALEVGRMFVRKEYRGRFAPILLLLKGIAYFISYNPHYRALIGASSVDNRYSRLSRQLMLSFFKKNHYGPRQARLVEPVVRGPARAGEGMKPLMTHLRSMGLLTRLISDIETDGKGVPRDLRHLAGFGGKVIGFGSSGAGGHSVLVLMDLMKPGRVPLSRFMGKEGLERFFAFHHDGREYRAA